jgi:hypothetical protein
MFLFFFFLFFSHAKSPEKKNCHPVGKGEDSFHLHVSFLHNPKSGQTPFCSVRFFPVQKKWPDLHVGLSENVR